MEVEHNVKVFPLDTDLEANLKHMSEEGWLLVPGIVPVAIYHVVRMKGITQHQGDDVPKPIVKVNVDDTKVKILRDGKLIDQ